MPTNYEFDIIENHDAQSFVQMLSDRADNDFNVTVAGRNGTQYWAIMSKWVGPTVPPEPSAPIDPEPEPDPTETVPPTPGDAAPTGAEPSESTALVETTEPAKATKEAESGNP